MDINENELAADLAGQDELADNLVEQDGLAGDLGDQNDLAVDAVDPNEVAVDMAEERGTIPLAASRVVNGNSTTIEQFPWIISLQYYGSHRCGGSIITTTRILTAAHCTIGILPSYLGVRAGSTDSQTGGQLIPVAQFTNHESYNPTTLENDISVVFIVSELNTAPAGVSVIPLPMQGAAVSDGVIANIAGWGALCEKCPGTKILQYVGLPILSNTECNSMYGGAIAEGMLCAGFVEGGSDACQV